MRTITRSPSTEEHIILSDNEFDFGGEYEKPRIEVSFNRANSGRDLIFHENSGHPSNL